MGVTIRAVEGGVEIPVRAAPRASRSEIAGVRGDALGVRLAAPPVEGAANEELRKLLADRLGVPLSDVEIVRGLRSRSKVVRIRGASPVRVARALRSANP